MSKPRIRVDLLVAGDSQTMNVAPDDWKVYQARREHSQPMPALPALLALGTTSALDRQSAFPMAVAQDALTLLQLQADDVEFHYAAVVQLRLRDDNVNLEYDAPGTGALIVASREDVQAKLLADFGVHLDLAVLTLDNPKLTRSLSIHEAVHLDE